MGGARGLSSRQCPVGDWNTSLELRIRYDPGPQLPACAEDVFGGISRAKLSSWSFLLYRE